MIQLDRTGTVEAFQSLLTHCSSLPEIKGLLVLVADGNGFTPKQINPILRGLEVPVFGGIFCHLIHGEEILSQGTLVVGLHEVPHIEVIQPLSSPSPDFDKQLEQAFLAKVRPGQTMFTVVDGFSRNIADLIESLFIIFGLEINYLGGGAGSKSLTSSPCVLTNEGLLQDAAVLALLDLVSGTGVSHGLQEVCGPFKITESYRNQIISIDWVPALEFYSNLIQQDCGKELTRDNLATLGAGYIFGLARLGAEMIARDPLNVTEDGHLLCAGDVPPGSFIHLLKADASSMINAASCARTQADNAFGDGAEDALVTVWDCISRKAFLQEDFGQELASIQKGGQTAIGALTIGEIANSGQDYLEFYNNTVVVGVTERK